ncbi:UNVERIFIED_ORG: hypothetical protein B2H93_04765 [Clostridium botulinum]
MENNGVKERYKTFCKAFDLNVGDVIKIHGWSTYIIGEKSFYISQDGKIITPKYQPYDQFMSRGFVKIKE